MEISSKEILIWQVLKDKIKDLKEAIISQEKIIQLVAEMDLRHYGKLGDYSKLEKIVTMLMKKRNVLIIKFNEIDKKIKPIIEKLIGEKAW